MLITEPLRLAKSYPIDDRCVVQLIGNYSILLAEKRFKNASVGIKSGGIQNRVLSSKECGDFGFKFLMNILGTADKAYAAEALPPVVHIFTGSFHNFGV